MTETLTEQLQTFEAKVPWAKALPYGIQHVLAMFVANLAPMSMIAMAAGMTDIQTAVLIQNAMLAAGIGTFIQLFGVWKVGGRLPIVMGVSFTFVTLLSTIAATSGYGVAMGAVIVGGVIEGVLGLFAKYWRRFITPIVAGAVVTSIGFSLLTVGANSFAGGSGAIDFASPANVALGCISLLSCLLFQAFTRGSVRQLSVLFGLVVGCVVAIPLGAIDFSAFASTQIVALPQLLPFTPEFDAGAIISVVLLYIVSATDTIGDTAAVTVVAFDREATEREFQGSIAADGFTSSLAGLLGCMPLDSFGQNIGLIAMTKVANRRAIACGAGLLVLGGFLPIIATLFSAIPNAVLGGCTIMMFGNILVSGFQMIARAGFSQKNNTIAAVSLAIGIGFTQVGMFANFPTLFQNLFAGNAIAVTFVVALVMSLAWRRDS